LDVRTKGTEREGRETSTQGRIGNSGTDNKGTGEETTIIGKIINEGQGSMLIKFCATVCAIAPNQNRSHGQIGNVFFLKSKTPWTLEYLSTYPNNKLNTEIIIRK
jgi:hypothetical protein